MLLAVVGADDSMHIARLQALRQCISTDIVVNAFFASSSFYFVGNTAATEPLIVLNHIIKQYFFSFYIKQVRFASYSQLV
jgi:hypothetical protein